jgi:uncharacterized iron-regulated membrane protein
MASEGSSTKSGLRKAWFQVHKWIGLILAILIIPLSLSGSVLVWDEWVSDTLHPERRVEAVPSQSPTFYAQAARGALAPNETLATLTYPEGKGPVVASAARQTPGAARGGRPARTLLYLDPTSGRVLDKASSDSGFVRAMHMLHGSLMVPGVGRQIVGWLGIAMLISSVSGLWLWWPFTGRFASGFRWRRSPMTSGNLHHQFGFWIALPLFVLSLTGAWISFPAFFASVSGDQAPRGPGGPGAPGGRNAAPLAETRLSPDQALTAAQPYATGSMRSIGWPTKPDSQWSVTYVRGTGTAEVKVADADGAAKAPERAKPETLARLMRRIHDGTRTGPLWQTIIFLGGLVPAGLAVTGVLMWLGVRKRRAKGARNRVARETALA